MKLKPKTVKSEDWEKAGGVFCPRCNAEVCRLINGLCPGCYQEDEVARIEKQEEKSMKRYYSRRLSKGTISLQEMREGHLGNPD